MKIQFLAALAAISTGVNVQQHEGTNEMVFQGENDYDADEAYDTYGDDYEGLDGMNLAQVSQPEVYGLSLGKAPDGWRHDETTYDNARGGPDVRWNDALGISHHVRLDRPGE